MSLTFVFLLSNSNYQLAFKRVVLLFLTAICVQACSKQERREGPTKSDTAQVSKNLTKEISEGPAKRIVELYYDYRGKLGSRKIGMMIGATKKGVVSGHYFYYDGLKDIEFTGQLLNSEEARLVEKDTLGNEVATFKLFFLKEDSVKGNQIIGVRTSRSGAVDSVYLQAENTVPSLSFRLKDDYDQRLAARKFEGYDTSRYVRAKLIDITDEKIESNIRAFYYGVLTGDKKKVVQSISYPIRIGLFLPTSIHGNILTIKGKKELLKRYDQIFTRKFIDVIKQTVPHDLGVIKGNIIMGNGDVWFNGNGFVIDMNVPL